MKLCRLLPSRRGLCVVSNGHRRAAETPSWGLPERGPRSQGHGNPAQEAQPRKPHLTRMAEGAGEGVSEKKGDVLITLRSSLETLRNFEK